MYKLVVSLFTLVISTAVFANSDQPLPPQATDAALSSPRATEVHEMVLDYLDASGEGYVEALRAGTEGYRVPAEFLSYLLLREKTGRRKIKPENVFESLRKAINAQLNSGQDFGRETKLFWNMFMIADILMGDIKDNEDSSHTYHCDDYLREPRAAQFHLK